MKSCKISLKEFLEISYMAAIRVDNINEFNKLRFEIDSIDVNIGKRYRYKISDIDYPIYFKAQGGFFNHIEALQYDPEIYTFDDITFDTSESSLQSSILDKFNRLKSDDKNKIINIIDNLIEDDHFYVINTNGIISRKEIKDVAEDTLLQYKAIGNYFKTYDKAFVAFKKNLIIN